MNTAAYDLASARTTMSQNHGDASNLAVLFDLENLAIGVRQAGFPPFDVELVLQRLLEKGNVIVKKAYADWGTFSSYRKGFHDAAVEMIEMPQARSGKNAADIKMVVDAMELSYTKSHIDTFALVSGDSDFSPLVSKLRENGKHIVGCGVKNSTSHLLIDNCDEFLLYDDLIHLPKATRARLADLPQRKSEAFTQLLDAANALLREDKALHGSLVKDTIKRKQPQFNEEYHGYSSFSRLLEDAQSEGLLRLRRDAKSGTYVIDELLEA